MSHSYPIAKNAKDALVQGVKAARTRAEAEHFTPEHVIDSLQTDWLPMTKAKLDAILSRPGDETGKGFLQQYEDEKGKPVLAVTYWKLGKKKPKRKSGNEKAPLKPLKRPDIKPGDHTDDLYFRRGRTKPGRRKYVDPNQMDLFGSSDDS